MTERYLGDGLYATFDGWQVILRAPRSGEDRWVGLEPEVMTSLIEFLAELNRLHSGVPAYQAASQVFQREDPAWTAP